MESSHIFPKEKDGSDDLRNGISLCKLHHWAFDEGLMSVTDDFNVIIGDWIKGDENYEAIYKFEGKKISLPKEVKFNPHPIYLREHRKNHGFHS